MQIFPRVFLTFLFGALVFSLETRAAEPDFLPGVKRLVFIGDSITYSGEYVDDFDLYLFAFHPDRPWEVINLGLPSETVSGLSEPNHAGGKFPRPDLHTRFARALAQTKPDLVLACYGMNDGIYLPFDEERFAKFREGMKWLHEQCSEAKAQIIHVTPPSFHALAARVAPEAKASENSKPNSTLGGYNLVLDRYSDWLLAQEKNGWRVIDVHGLMNAAIDEHRRQNPDFAFAKDGVHPDAEGHALMAAAIVASLAPGDAERFRSYLADPRWQTPEGKALRDAIRARGRILTDAWLTSVGHARPGMHPGLPLDEAEKRATELEKKIIDLAATPALKP